MGADQKRGLLILRVALVAGAVAFLAWRLRADGPALRALHLDGRWLPPALGALGIALAGQVAAWRWNLRRLGADVGYGPLFRVYYVWNLARYVPGKVWSVAGMVAGGVRLGVEAERMSASVFLGLVSSLVSGVCVGAAAAALTGRGGDVSAAWGLVPLAALGLLWPSVYRRWAGWVLARLGRRDALPEITGGLLARSVGHYALVWCAYAASAGALGASLDPSTFGLYFAVFPLAYVAGYAALFAPGGWGVREGALVLLAGGGAAALGVSILQRFMLTAAELVLFGYAIWSSRHD